MSATVYRLIAVSVVSTSCLLATTALAQFREDTQSGFRDRLRQEGVRTRQRPDYDAIGVRAGSFLVYPTMEAEVGYDSNVFEQDDNDETDFYYAITPGVRAQSTWSRHGVEVSAQSRSTFFQDVSGENTTDYNFRGRGFLDVGVNSRADIDVRYSVGHDSRGEPGSQADPANACSPTALVDNVECQAFDRPRWTDWTIEGSWQSRMNRFSYATGLTFTSREYAPDTYSVTNGAIYPADRDFQIWETSLELAYDFSPRYTGFIRAEGNTTNYEALQDRTPVIFNALDVVPGDPLNSILEFDKDGDTEVDGFNRDSHGFTAVVGAKVELTSLLVGEFAVGYLRQNYEEDPRLDDIKGPIVQADLEWYPRPDLTARFTASRKVINRVVREELDLDNGADSNGDGFALDPYEIYGASGGFQFNVGVGADYEWQPNVIFSGDLLYTNEQFVGTDRNDDIYRVGLRGDYFFNHRTSAGIFYDFVMRDSTEGFAEYMQHLAGIRVRVQL